MEIRLASLTNGAAAAVGTTVIIDVFRAFTRAAVAPSRGARHIVTVDSLDKAIALLLRAARRRPLRPRPRNSLLTDSLAERRGFEPVVPRENGWPVLTTLIDLKALLLSENQATSSPEGPTVRIPFAPP
jgi:2-phosphosulfolactate phosphatase